MGFWDKFKKTLEWARLAKFVADCLITLGSLKAVKALLTHFQLSPEWVSAISALIAGAILLMLIWWQNRPIKSAQTTQGAAPTTALAFQNVDAFYRTYDNVLLSEAETSIKNQAVQYREGRDREAFLVRTLASGFILTSFEKAWLTIFKSQLIALQQLNTRPMTVDELRPFYDEAAANNPRFFGNYPFEGWLAYMGGQVLTRQDGQTIQITVRGREFLKYIVQSGFSVEMRSN